MTKILCQLIYPFFLSAWRRCFGSDGWDIPILKERFVQHVIGFAACFGVLFVKEVNVWQNIIFCLILQALYWSRSHGCCFDFGHGQPPDLSRYDQLWYWKYVKKIIPESQWYTFWGDYILMVVRYGLPSLLLGAVALSPVVCFAGFVLATVYAFCWTAYDWGMTKTPTATAEWISGFTTGVFIAFL